MCVGFWTLEHPQYALILCSNRDEFLSRPTTQARWHSFGAENEGESGTGAVLSGRDVLAGGTWAGISRTGRVALLTNITEPHGRYNSSRGTLTSSFLLPESSSATLQEEVDRILAQDARYAGFNLLLLCPSRSIDHGDGRCLSLEAAFLTNSGGGGKIKARILSETERRCGAMSNGIDYHGAAEWPKVRRGSQMFQDTLSSVHADTPESDLTERLFELLTWKSEVPPSDRTGLRDTIQVEPLQVPNAKPSGGTTSEPYGTRLSTVILIRRDGGVLFLERDIWTLDREGAVTKADPKQQRTYRFQIHIEDSVKR
ncbi:DUF833-domain-containing protein [Obba rivulosa]|uniref:DUF833-domain-containing protein n=1 Tax=Obba rivulosa TaxID=1052685 RepID=A0A8E2AWF4_9APHY|nr:DUF833-domain-containing protein [Obba rivulosa]